MRKPAGWKCPHCDTTQYVTDGMRDQYVNYFNPSEGQKVTARITLISCAHDTCGRVSVSVELTEFVYVGTRRTTPPGGNLYVGQVYPSSSPAKAFSAAVPAPLIKDYREACEIVDLSPKASATLSRRCLQGMIRDFWGVKKKNLFLEIDALEGKVQPEVWDAMDSLRELGNIGAHMRKDINVIIEIEPGEARALIELIEMLFEEWYEHRAARQQKLEKIKAIAESKNESADAKGVPVAEATDRQSEDEQGDSPERQPSMKGDIE